MVIQIDSREKVHAITRIIEEFDRRGIQHPISKLYVGDYQSFDNPRVIVDRKQNLIELAGNVCQQHERFINEIYRANDTGIKLIFLCEHGKGIRSLEDVKNWKNPRLRFSPKAITGERLYKILDTISKRHNVTFEFCDKEETGLKIIQLLGGKTT